MPKVAKPGKKQAAKLFVEACAGGDVETVRRLLRMSGKDSVDVHLNGDEAFDAACRGSRVSVVRELLALKGSRSIDLNANGGATFLAVCNFGRSGVLDALLAVKGKNGVKAALIRGRGFDAANNSMDPITVLKLLELRGPRVLNSLGEESRQQYSSYDASWKYAVGLLECPCDYGLDMEEPSVRSAWCRMSASDGLMNHPRAHPTLRSAARCGRSTSAWMMRRRAVLSWHREQCNSLQESCQLSKKK